MRRTKHIGFDALARRVAREYEGKGFSRKTARKWGRETAAKVFREKGGRRRRRRSR